MLGRVDDNWSEPSQVLIASEKRGKSGKEVSSAFGGVFSVNMKARSSLKTSCLETDWEEGRTP